MKISVIDIGTNTILLLVAQTMGNESKGFSTTSKSSQDSAKESMNTDSSNRKASIGRQVFFRIFKKSKDLGSELIVAVGTSAIRDASNRKEFCGFIREKTGIEIQVLTGEEEAEWTFRGAIGEGGSVRKLTVLDIGGGTSEIIFGNMRGSAGK